MVVPKELRERIGLVPGEVEIEIDGAALRLVPVAADRVHEVDGRLVVARTGVALTDDDVRALRDADRR